MANPPDVYSWATPNGHKVHILLEELGIDYNLIPVNIFEGEQFSEEFGEINPNRRIPALVDNDYEEPLPIFETGAIMLHLAEKHERFIGQGVSGRSRVIQWLMWQMAGLGPMLGQGQHFHFYAREKHPYSIDRYTNEGERLLLVMERQLEKSPFLAEEYSIADMACFPWVRIHKLANLSLEDKPNLRRWYGDIRGRPAVDRALALLREHLTGVPDTDAAHDVMFGKTQFEKR